jgi:hypothetical protein
VGRNENIVIKPILHNPAGDTKSYKKFAALNRTKFFALNIYTLQAFKTKHHRLGKVKRRQKCKIQKPKKFQQKSTQKPRCTPTKPQI